MMDHQDLDLHIQSKKDQFMEWLVKFIKLVSESGK